LPRGLVRRRLFALALTLAACGGSASPEPAPVVEAPVATAPVVAPAPPPPPPPPPVVALPYELARDAPLPPAGTAERALIDRWGSLLFVNVAEQERRLYFVAERSEIALLEGTQLVMLSGSGDESPRAVGGSVFLLERDGVPGPVLDVEVSSLLGAGIDADVVQPPTPWLRSAGACDDASVRAHYAARHALGVGMRPGEPCEDLMPRLASSLLARADATTPEDAVRHFLADVVNVAMHDARVEVVERPRDLRGRRDRGARFVPFVVTRDADGLRAEGTVVTHTTCAVVVPYDSFTLRATATELVLEHVAVSRETLTTRCR
jgi:hypothetical protein